MKLRFRLPSRAATLIVVAALGASAPFLTQPARTAPKKVLEIWPGRRVLFVLPLSVSANWNSDPALGTAILPLAQPELERALLRTGKFSLTLPYRFDPVLRRGLTEKRLVETEVSALLAAPSVESASPIVSKLIFDQPVMMAQIKLEEVRVGGTAELPTVQIQASGTLFQQQFDDKGVGSVQQVKTITATSAPSGGRTPSDRLALATSRAFDEIAAAFVAPPAAFDLPTPIPPTPAPTTAATASAATASGTTSGAAPGAGATAPGTPGTTPGAAAARTPAPRPVGPPTPLSPAPGVPFVPQLPAGTPPLGIAVGEGGAGN
ncbi:MAG TPA: hypothetical protein VF627_07315 [Abditibacterium sp.]|jgi:hypothetical protein